MDDKNWTTVTGKGRGRGRGRGRSKNQGQVCKPGRPQAPAEHEARTCVSPNSEATHNKGMEQGRPQTPAEHEAKAPNSEATDKGMEPLIHQSASLGRGVSESPVYRKKESLEKVVSKQRFVDPEDLGFQFKRKLSLTTAVVRPDEGTAGKRIKLIANCFPIKVPSGNVYHYDVTINRKQGYLGTGQSDSALLPAIANPNDKKYRCLSTKMNRNIINLMLSVNPLFENSYAAFDGQKNLYTRNPLDVDIPIKCTVTIPNENAENQTQDEFEVKIQPVTRKESNSCAISLDLLHAFFDKRTSSVPQDSVMALETILRHGPCLRYTPIGRSFFCPPDPASLHPLGGGLEIWFGHHQSIRLGQWGPMVNLNLTATTFYEKGPLIRYVAECLNTTEGKLRQRTYLPNTEIKRLCEKLKDLRIEVTHLRNYRRKYRILRVLKESASRFEFDLTVNGRTVKRTISAYFRERYGKVLEYPNLPCIQVYPESKKTCLPIEVCEILEGQHSKKKLEGKQKADMIKFTATKPLDRFLRIGEIANTECNDNIARQFNLEVSPKPICLEGRVLDSPSVQYKNGKTIKPSDGSWKMIHNQFLKGAVVNSWALLNFANVSSPSLNNFSDLLVQVGIASGLTIQRPACVKINASEFDLKGLLLNMKKEFKADLVVIVLPSNDKYIYGRIKQIAETNIGLATQCVKSINVSDPKKCNISFVANLCQKINAKVGGENNSLVISEIPIRQIIEKPVIIIGADVNHPGQSLSIKPSLAACVGSLDTKMSRYAVCIRAQANVDEQKQSVEVIQDLKSMIIELLKKFYCHTRGKKPEKIIFYRDGVSEGQFEKVRAHEVRCIREACRSLPDHYEPGITFIVVQKRHHTRFMPECDRDGVGAMKNIPPGTTVDTAISHPLNFDFFLCSHFGLKGTSRPSHYTVMEDDNNFKADDLQKLTYQLCHTSARCTKSISIPVPVAYADLAAYRARLHLEAGVEESTASSDSSTSSSNLYASPESVMNTIKVIDEFKSAMYFV